MRLVVEKKPFKSEREEAPIPIGSREPISAQRHCSRPSTIACGCFLLSISMSFSLHAVKYIRVHSLCCTSVTNSFAFAIFRSDLCQTVRSRTRCFCLLESSGSCKKMKKYSSTSVVPLAGCAVIDDSPSSCSLPLGWKTFCHCSGDRRPRVRTVPSRTDHEDSHDNNVAAGENSNARSYSAAHLCRSTSFISARTHQPDGHGSESYGSIAVDVVRVLDAHIGISAAVSTADQHPVPRSVAVDDVEQSNESTLHQSAVESIVLE